MDSWLSFGHDIAPPGADHLGDTRAGVVQSAEHGAVPLASPSAGIWGLDDGADLVARQKADHRPVKALLPDRETSLDSRQGIKIVVSSVF
jgi:hypothetical protein